MSSLLSLDADIWRCLSVILKSSDLPRLLMIGNRALSNRLKTGIRSINLEWLSYRYIDLDQVFTSIAPLKNATSVTFRQPTCWIRCWTPVNWSLLPTSLTSLSLTFLGAPEVFLHPDRLQSTFGSLLHLLLEDTLENTLEDTNPNTSKISFLGLPPTLLSLIIRGTRDLLFSVAELESLPPYLEDLELGFPVCFVPSNQSEALDGGATREAFPRLSLPLKRLKLIDNSAFHWLIRCADLPVTLETLHFEVHKWRALQYHPNAYNAHDCTMIDLDGIKKLVNLQTLQATDLESRALEVMSILPDTLTQLELDFHDKDTDQLDEAIARLGPKMRRLAFSETNGFVSAFLSEDGPRLFPLVHTFDMYGLHGPYSNLPNTITRLSHPQNDIPGLLPLSIRKYRIMPPEYRSQINDQIPINLPWTPQHTNLQELILPPHNQCTLPTGWYQSLPPSLRKLKAELKSFDCLAFLEYLTQTAGITSASNSSSAASSSTSSSTCSRLPNLEVFKNKCIVDWHCLGLAASSALPRLRKLELDIAESLISDSPACMSVLEALTSSKLEHLHLRIYRSAFYDSSSMVIPLLNHLPRGLKTLHLEETHMAKFQWPVKLPNTLQSLTVAYFTSANREVDIKIEKEGVPLAAPEGVDSFQFPPSLVHLALYTREAFPIEALPPYLSLCYMGPGQASFVDQITEGKVHSSSNQTLFEFKYRPDGDF